MSEAVQDKIEAARAGTDEDYLRLHGPRFDRLLEWCRALAPARDARVVDIGWGPFSRLLTQHYDRVFTLGYANDDPEGRGLAGHITFDLNEAFTAREIPTDERFDVVVFAETIEHLIAPPDLVLRLLSGLLAEGGRIICQTPNAAAFGHRMRLLFGANPYEPLRPTPQNLGHIRELTGRELKEAAARAGLAVERHVFYEPFALPEGVARRMGEGVLRGLSKLAPSFRRGQMAVLARP